MKRFVAWLMVVGFIMTVGIACGKSPEKARKELGQMGIQYSEKAFIESVKNNDNLAIELFLRAEINPNAKDRQGKTALMWAVWRGGIDNIFKVLKALLAEGADVNAKDKDGWTALMSATACDKGGIVKFLLANGADVNAKTNDGWTALMLAAKLGHHRTVKALLAKGADVNAKDGRGKTALMYAAGDFWEATYCLTLLSSKSNHPEIVKILLANGADVNEIGER